MAGKSAILSVRILGDASGASKSFDQASSGMDKMTRDAEKMGDRMNKAGLVAGAALTKGLVDAVSDDTANRKLAGSMGLDPAEAEAAGKIAGAMYRDGYGASMEEVNAAIGSVSSTLADLSANGGADVDRLSKKALDLASTFEVDTAEAVSTAGALLKNGLAADGDEAFDLLVGSLQKMPKAMQGELFPVLDEYSKHFADLGIDGQTALGMLTMASEDGAIGMDKLGDSLKELTIRATDGSATTVAAYEAMGLSSEEMTAKMLAGGPQAQEAFGKIVAGLQGMEDPASQAAAAIALFGTPLEDLGTAGIPDFLGAIDPMGDAFDSTAGAADKLSETVNNGPGVAFETLKREALGSLQDMASNAMPLLMPIIGLLQQFAPVLGPLAVAVLVAAGAAKAAAAAQALWNGALLANPIGIVVAILAALVAGVIWAYQNVGWFKDAVDTAGQIAGAVFGAIIGWVSGVVSWLVNVIGQSQTFQAAVALIGTVFEVAGQLGKAAMGWIIEKVTSAVDWVKKVTSESETFQNIISGLKAVATATFGAIDTAISTTIGWVKDAVGWFGSLFGAKNDAASVQVDGGGAGSSGSFAAMAAPAPLLGSRMLAADPFALAYSQPGAATYSAAGAGVASNLTAATVSALQSRQSAAPVSIKIEVKADATTDRAALGRELGRSINAALASVGQKKLVNL